jgi:5'-nucleotidase
VVNHFKSKGSAGPQPRDADSGDGQGSSNATRVAQAKAQRDWVPTVLPSGTDSVVMVGDYNSYGQEDPLQVLFGAGYTDAEQHFDLGKYSYSFSGLSGSLDHVLMNNAALARATGADIWNINSPESIALEYSRYNYHGTLFYRNDPYASSDHDPVVAGLKATTPPTEVQILGTNDFHGRIQNNGVEAGAAVMATAVKQLRSEHPKTVFAAAGDLIGASTFESFIAHDKPTIDALNAAGLEVSAVGNHEFDQGYTDLVNRVMAPYNPVTNPYGGAAWQYLGANVRHDDGSAALPESWVQNFGDVKVGFVGAVTDHLDELVSPAGIAGLQIEAPIVAANREADKLKEAGADLVILLVHEGAATTALSSATDPASDMGRIVNGADENIDAIISGHTHLAYNHAIPVQAWIDEGRPVTTRPVVSAGQYGYNLNQLVFSVDKSGEVVGLQQKIVPLTTATTSGTTTTYTPNYKPDQDVAAIVATAVTNASVLGAVKLGSITGAFNRAKLANGTTENRGGESTLGNLVAEVQRWATEQPESGSAQIAFMNPGGLRQDMVGVGTGAYPRDLTYQQAAVVQPFANTLVNMKLTGAQIKTALEQQWQPTGAARPYLRLGVSAGFTYTYDPAAAAGARITGMWLDGEPIDVAASYSVTVNSFLAAGGDNFFELANGTNKRDTGKVDLQAMVDYLAAKGTASPDYAQRAVGVHFPDGAPAEYGAGDTVAFALSSLAFSTADDTKDSQVSVKLGDTALGSFDVDNTIGTDIFDEYGKARVSVVLPAGAPSGAQVLTVTGAQTGTTVLVPITVAAGQTAVGSTTTLTSTAGQQVYGTGSPATFTATVTLTDGSAPAGSVTFTNGGTELGSAPVSGGKATFTVPSTTPAATLKVVATFVPQDTAVATGSPSTSMTFVVSKAIATSNVALSWVKSGSKFALTMKTTVTLSNGRSPVGTVAFNVNGTKLGEAPLSGGVASLTKTVNKGSAEVITTFIPTDSANVEPGAKGRATANVRAGASTTSVKAAVAKSVVRSGNHSVTKYRLTATANVASGGKAVAGKVTFTVGGKNIRPVTLVKGSAKVSVAVAMGATKVVATFTPTGTAPVAASSKAISVNVR